jgi:hypothetical protein
VDAWTALFWTACVVGGCGSLYALHRLALLLEENGHLYYLHKKPKGGGASCFVALQQALEPQVQHVIQVTDKRHLLGEKGGSGQGDPDDLGEVGSESRDDSDKP